LKEHIVKRLILAATIAAAFSLPSIANAQTSSMQTPSTDMTAPMICHMSKTGEMSNAMMTSSKMTCRPMNVARVRAAMKTMMAMPNLSAAQMAQMQVLMDEMQLEPAIPGGNGNATDPGGR
jgi:hypothetical protein